MKLLKIYILNFFKGHERTVKAKKHIIYSLFLKGISIAVGLAFVPLILNYLDAERYGIWLTLSSIIAWFSFFDIGLGNGLRNRFAEALAKNDHELARTYVSTTYAILGIIFFVVIVIFLFINPLLNWQKILNTTAVGTTELAKVAAIVFVFFILRFFFKLIGTILMADQRPAINNAFGPISNLLALIIIYILTKTTKEGSLVTLAAVLSIVPVGVFILATIVFFLRDYRKYAPSFKYIDLSKSRDLLGLGIKFFYFQITAIVLFSTTNFLIAHFSNQEMVAAYNVAYKYLFITNMIYGIILMPFWSAVTDAYARKDYNWLKKSIKKLNLLSFIMAFAILGALFISPWVYKIWIGNKLTIPFSLSLVIALYLIQQIITAPFSTFINGFGKLKLGLYMNSLTLILFFLLAYFLGKNYGAIGIVLSILIVRLFSLYFEAKQVYKLVNNKAKGLWNE